MAHEKVYGFCENKCKVEVSPKTVVDGLLSDVAALEGVSNGGAIKSKSITNSGTITSTGQIVANGGVKGNLTGNVTGNTQGLLFVKATVGTSGDETYATLAKQTLTITAQDSNSAQSITCNNYVKSYSTPKKHCVGVYTRASDLTGSPINPSVSSRRLTVKWYAKSAISGSMDIFFWYKKSSDASFTRKYFSASNSSYAAGALIDTLLDINVPVGTTYQFYINREQYNVIAEYAAGTTYKVKYATP